MNAKDKSTRGNASQFFVAGELCRRGYCAVVTLGNTPNTDVLCSNLAGTKFVHIQVKTFVPGNRTCSVGVKAERNFGESFFWVLSGIPTPEMDVTFEYYVIPAAQMAPKIIEGHQRWLASAGARSQAHNDSSIRSIYLPPRKSPSGWDISEFRDRWDLIEERLRG